MIAVNHDLKQSKFSFDPGDGSVEDEVNVIKSIHAHVNHPNLYYFEDTGLYSMQINEHNIVFAVWSQKAKFSTKEMPYNPWYLVSQKTQKEQDDIRQVLANSIVIELFHDPVKNCIAFNGDIVKGDNDHRVDVKEFYGDFVLMGDIHMPSIIKSIETKGDKWFASYPSSPIIRFFDEGDYYTNSALIQEGNNKHGYNEVLVNSKTDFSIEFVPIKQYSTKHTIAITADFTDELISTFELKNPGTINYIQIVLSSYQSIDILDKLIKHLHDKYVCVISTKTPSINVTQNNLNETFDVSKINSVDYLLKVGRQCIEDKVNSTKDSQDYKDALINSTFNLYKEALESLSLTSNILKFRFDSLTLNNFMPLTHLHIDFNDLKSIDGIVKINGNNGVGKTTIYKGITWLAVGKIDWRQSDIKTKQNNLDYFNDKAYDVDVVDGSLSVIRQTDNAKIETKRKITRYWHAKATIDNKKSVDWRNFISNVSSEVEVYVNDELQTPEQGKALLDTIFGDYNKFTTLHMVNQASLDSMLLNMNINQLVDYILKAVGFDIVEKLQQNKDVAKAKIFKDLTKHAKDINGINIDINTALHNIEDYEIENKSILENIELITAKIVELESKNNEANATRLVEDSSVNIADKETLLTTISNTQQEIANIRNAIDNPSWSEQKQQTLDALTKENDALQTEQQNKTLNIVKITGSLNALQSDKQTLQSKLDNIQLQIANLKADTINKLNNELQQKQNSVDLAFSNIKDSYNNLLASINESSNKSIAEFTQLRNSKSDMFSKISAGIAVLETNQESLTKELNDKQTGECNVCLKNYAAIDNVKVAIDEIQSKINDNALKLTKLNDAKDAILKEIEELDLKINNTKLVQQSADFISHFKELSSDLSLIDLYNNAVNEHNEFSATCKNTISELELSTDKLLTDEHKLALDAIEKQRASIASKEEQLQNEQLQINKDFAAAQEKISALIVQIQELNDEKSKSDVVSLYKRNEELLLALNNDNLKLSAITQKEQAIQHNSKVDDIVKQNIINIDAYKSEQKTLNSNIARNNNSISTYKANIENYRRQIEDIKNYEFALNIEKVYQHLIGNKGLNKYIFDIVALQINAELNALLEDLNFGIFFDLSDNYTLKMVDLLGFKSVRNLYTIGGMESTIGALSLVAIIKSKTVKSNGDFLFIDEITGKLNDAKDTKGSEVTNKDYQFEAFQILKKLSKTTNITIIDHVLPIDWFKSVIEIVKYDNGKSELV
jgi:DNA repair exonuclease SbcCD ATPase subunit